MDRRAWTSLLVLAALWGASYLFIKYGLESLSPAMVVFSRLALAAVTLIPLALYRRALAPLRGRLRAIVVLAAVQVAGPFLLITFGEKHITSSMAGILVASAPIFTALLAIRVDHSERSEGAALAGILIGIVGVVLLFGVDLSGDSKTLLGGLMVLVAALGYAIGSLYLKRHLSDVPSVGIVTATMTTSALMVLPWALATFPTDLPSGRSTAAMLALGAGGTGAAFVLFYGLITTVGAAKASVVAYLAPGFAVLYGALLLDEPITASTIAGLTLILAGSFLAGGGTLRRRAGATTAAAATAPTHAAAAPARAR